MATRKAARVAAPSLLAGERIPTRAILLDCCARTTIGHATAPPSTTINARRLIPRIDIRTPRNVTIHHSTGRPPGRRYGLFATSAPIVGLEIVRDRLGIRVRDRRAERLDHL